MEPTYVIAGCLRRDYLLPPQGRPLIDVPGGNLLYAASGAGVWDKGIGLLGRAGEDYPHEWLRAFEKRGFDVRGLHILTEEIDLRFFQAYLDQTTFQCNNPVQHFARLGLTFPKTLLGYQPPAPRKERSRSPDPASPRPVDIPKEYLDTRAVHLCSLDYPSASRLIQVFQQGKVTSLTLDPSPEYMTLTSWKDVCFLVHGLTAFMPSEEELRLLFWGQTDDLWAMAEAIASNGCELVIVKRGGRGQMLYDADAHKRWEIPAYPVRVVDPTGAGDSFCGGFLAGYHHSYDPLQAVMQGNISASLTIEGSGAFHALEVLPGLARARLASLSELVRQV